jgi:DNA-binding NarL/FixJ family response regulator
VTIRVLVVDDQQLIRAGLRGIVESAGDLTVVDEAGTGVQAVQLTRRHRPDVVLMDIRMPDMDGLEATRLITATTQARVLVVTTFDLDEYVYAALRAGAGGFLLKDTAPADLLAAVRIVAAGDALRSPGITRRLIAEFAARPELRPELGQRLHITPGTAKTHVGNLLTKLDARDRVQLVILAYRTGLVTVP